MLYLSVLKTQSLFSVDLPRSVVAHSGIHKIKGHKEYKLCSLKEFQRKVAFIETGEEQVVSILPNNVEQD